MATNFRKIPSVTSILEDCLKQPWSKTYSRENIVDAIREEVEQFRDILKDRPAGELVKDWAETIRDRISGQLEPSLRRVINASGIIVHTNLGRAPLAQEVLARIGQIAGYSNLEFDLETGQRGSRDLHLEKFVRQLLPVEASLVTNNNAAALLLILNSLAEGKEVIVSRGELVEIGGSFRLPEIMKKSGAILREVGTTNKTRILDYENAIHERTALILVVHPSNYQIIGFTEHPDLAELIKLGNDRGIPVVEDHGSGILLDLKRYGIDAEPAVAQRLKQGLDLICFSGDKILGGPQAGIICGRKALIEKLKQNPLFRALRVDKITYAALEATLTLHLCGRTKEIPVVRMLSEPVEEMRQRGERWLSELREQIPDADFRLEPTECFIGGGVAPMKSLPSLAVAVSRPDFSAHQLAVRLRRHTPPVIARVDENRLLLELRTIPLEDQQIITSALQQILSC